TTQVHAEDRHTEIADEPRHRQQRAVAAEHEQQIHLPRKLRLARGRHREVGTEACGLFLDQRLQAAVETPLQELRHDAPSFLTIRLGDDADSLHEGSSATTRLMSASRSGSVRPVFVRCRKNSRLPLGPRSGEAATPRTCQLWRTAKRATRL